MKPYTDSPITNSASTSPSKEAFGAEPLLLGLLPKGEQSSHPSDVPVGQLDGAEAVVEELLQGRVQVEGGALEVVTLVRVYLGIMGKIVESYKDSFAVR